MCEQQLFFYKLFIDNNYTKSYRAIFHKLVILLIIIILHYFAFLANNYRKRLSVCSDILIFSKTLEVQAFLFFLPLCFPTFYRSAYIFFRGRPRSYVADVFSRFISEILSWSNFHCDPAVRYTFSCTPTCISHCHPLSPTRSSVLSLIFPRSFYPTRFYLRLGLSYRSDSTHSRAVSYSWPL